MCFRILFQRLIFRRFWENFWEGQAAVAGSVYCTEYATYCAHSCHALLPHAGCGEFCMTCIMAAPALPPATEKCSKSDPRGPQMHHTGNPNQQLFTTKIIFKSMLENIIHQILEERLLRTPAKPQDDGAVRAGASFSHFHLCLQNDPE